MLQTSLLLMKSLNKTEAFFVLSVMYSLLSKATFYSFISYITNQVKLVQLGCEERKNTSHFHKNE